MYTLGIICCTIGVVVSAATQNWPALAWAAVALLHSIESGLEK